MGKSRSYKEHLDKRLKDPEESAAYLNAALEDEDPAVFLLALRDIARANGGMSYLSKQAHVNREALYRTLSKKGNPTLINLRALLGAMGAKSSWIAPHYAEEPVVSRLPPLANPQFPCFLSEKSQISLKVRFFCLKNVPYPTIII